jgi:hypothetical protein
MHYIVYGCIKETFAIPVEAESKEEAIEVVAAMKLYEFEDYTTHHEIESLEAYEANDEQAAE